jgi:hypothetical protein
LIIDAREVGPITTDLKKAIDLSIELHLDETPIRANGEYVFSSTAHKFEGDLNITKFNLKRLESLLKQPIECIVTTNQALIFSGNSDAFSLKTEGATKAINLKFKNINVTELSLKQKLMISRTTQNLKIQTQGDFNLQNLLVGESKISNLNWTGQVEFEQPTEYETNELPFDIRVDGDLSVTGLLDPSLGKIDTTNITSISFIAGEALIVESIIINGIDGSLTRAEDGSIVGLYENQISDTETAPDSPNEPARPNEQKASTVIASENPFANLLPLEGINIERLEILNSQLKF